ncbi:MAG: hypothetical protein UH853_10080 [Muribaculaceae bacterium]|nr:hypothetical protein [Muribaculaceae bacterium]
MLNRAKQKTEPENAIDSFELDRQDYTPPFQAISNSDAAKLQQNVRNLQILSQETFEKGNIGANGLIYTLSSAMPSITATKKSPSQGELRRGLPILYH